MFIYNTFFLSILSYNSFGYYLNSSIWTINFTNSTTRAFMFIFFIMRHDHITLESLEHYKIFPVVRIFLGDNFTRTEKISVGNLHPSQERTDSLCYFFKILNYTIHIDIIISVLWTKNANPSEPKKP